MIVMIYYGLDWRPPEIPSQHHCCHCCHAVGSTAWEIKDTF